MPIREMEHTSGPWHADGEHVEDIYSRSGELIAAAYPFVDEKRPTAERLAEQKANALLIAAAPDLGELVLSTFLHISHGGPTREQAEIVLKKAGLL
jgi:hypothetical protein